jgi:hypothetical protein
MYGLNLERYIFDKILYEVDSSDIPRKLFRFHMERFNLKKLNEVEGTEQ